MNAKAIVHFKKAVILTGENEAGMISGLGYAYAVSGNREEAREILDRLLALSSQRMYPHSTSPAFTSAWVTETRRFNGWKKRIQTARNGCYLNIEHMLDPIRDDPRLIELVKKVGLVN